MHDSVIRTSDGYRSFCQGFFLKGVANILLARIETAGAFLLAALYAIPLIAISIVITPVFLAAAIPLNLASRIPGISSFESVQHFTSESEDAIFRIIKETLIVLPVIFLFLSGAAINVIPGVLGEENIFFSSVDWLVESLGRLKTICAVVDDRHFEGMRERATILTALEEYLRAFSTKNYLEEIPCDSVWYHSTVSY
ncbi:MAG: hypothetical protein JJT82_08420 [Legionellaceae bacterium]|nr:hypothetical protein [Legionellaceae bacterium]